MPPVRVLVVDDLVLRAEVLALGLSGYPDIVVVGRLRLSDDDLGPRSAAAPADVALVSLSEGLAPGGADRPGGAADALGSAGASSRWLIRLADDLRGSRSELHLVALVDPREGEFLESVERSGPWMCVDTTRSLDELHAFLVEVAGHTVS